MPVNAVPQFDEITKKHLGLIISREENFRLWQEILGQLEYVPVDYTNEMCDFQLAYQRGHGGEWWDLSIVLYSGKDPCGIWPLSFSISDAVPKISGFGQSVMPPLFHEDLPKKTLKRLTKSCLDIAAEFAQSLGLKSWTSAESFAASIGLSVWHREAMSRGAQTNLRHELFLNLEPDMADIKSQFRKSYKSLISAGMQLWEVGVLDRGNDDTWDEFRRLHRRVAGRVTRSADTWSLQYTAIKEGGGFMVYLRDKKKRMIGGGLFNISKDECLYGVGAYDRSLFKNPLGHVVQYRAIEEMKKRGLRWYKIGLRLFASETPAPTQKEINISEFKQGFASHIFPKYILKHTVDSL